MALKRTQHRDPERPQAPPRDTNVCESCDNFTPAPAFAPVLAAQLDDVRELRSDAAKRGWTAEADRHGRVIHDLETHLRHLDHEHA